MALLPNIFGWNRPNARYARFWVDSPKIAFFGKIVKMLAKSSLFDDFGEKGRHFR